MRLNNLFELIVMGIFALLITALIIVTERRRRATKEMNETCLQILELEKTMQETEVTMVEETEEQEPAEFGV